MLKDRVRTGQALFAGRQILIDPSGEPVSGVMDYLSTVHANNYWERMVIVGGA